MQMETTALTNGAPQKIIDITEMATTAGLIPPFAPEAIASRTQNAPMAPRIPATRDSHNP